MESVKHFTRLAALKFGVEIHSAGELGGDPFRDMRQLTPARQPVVFDVGGNMGNRYGVSVGTSIDQLSTASSRGEMLFRDSALKQPEFPMYSRSIRRGLSFKY